MSAAGSTAARSRGRPRRHSADEILAVAERLLRGEGVRSVSVRRIADELSCAPMTIYSSFATKQALIDALAARLLAAHDTLPNEELPVEQRIADWMWRFRDAAREGRLFELFSARAPLNSLVEAGAAWTEQLQRAGWSAAEAATFAHHLVSTVIGFCLTWSDADRLPVPAAAAAEVRPQLRAAATTFLSRLPRNTDDVLYRLLVDAVVKGFASG